MTLRRARPVLLLAILLPLTLVVEGGVYAFLYPRFALFAWILPAVFGIATAGSALYVLPEGRNAGQQWVAAAVAVLIAQATGLLAVLLRDLLLLERYGEASSWTQFAQPARWWSLQQAVVRLEICCSRGGDVFSPLPHWSFLAFEFAATLGGAIYAVLTLQRQRRLDGRLPDRDEQA